jgi:Holliday junction DNA helicase RuvA
MIYSLKGKLILKQDNYFVVDIGGAGLKVISSFKTTKNLPAIGSIVDVFTHLHLKEDALELYGFFTREELDFFEMLIGISGIGPRSAVGILGIEKVEKLKAAINEGRAELLTKASGVGKKTADRIILELRGKLKQIESAKIVGLMESDQDIAEALVNLGYTKSQVKEALSQVDSKIRKTEERIKEALRLLKQ